MFLFQNEIQIVVEISFKTFSTLFQLFFRKGVYIVDPGLTRKYTKLWGHHQTN